MIPVVHGTKTSAINHIKLNYYTTSEVSITFMYATRVIFSKQTTCQMIKIALVIQTTALIKVRYKLSDKTLKYSRLYLS